MSKFEFITPSQAKSMLDRTSKVNRAVRSWHVAFLANEIACGRFIPGMILVSGGNVIDGQHRLLACIRADKPIAVQIIDVGESDVTSIDPLRQTKADVLTRKSGSMVSFAVARMAQMLANLHGGDAINYIDSARKRCEAWSIRDSQSMVAFAELDPDRRDELEFGMSIREESTLNAVLLSGWLREQPQNKSATRGKAAAVRKAFNATRDGKKLTRGALTYAFKSAK